MATRIALLHYSVPPVVGGVEAVIGAHARLLAEAGHEVRLVAGRGRRPEHPAIELVRIPLADTRHPRVVRARRALAGGEVTADFDLLVRELTESLRSALDCCDALIAHNVATFHFNLALTAALEAVSRQDGGPPLVTWTHDIAAAEPWYVGELHAGWPWDLVRRPWPSAIPVAVSRTRRDQLVGVIGLPLETVRVIPNGTDPAGRLGLHPATRRLAAHLDLGGPGPILLVPSRITPRKNLELAVRVLAQLGRHGSAARLVVTGALDPHDPGSVAYLGRLRALALELDVETRVTFVSAELAGDDSPAIVRDLYGLADLLLLTSLDEGFGLPLIEAAVTRLPIVCPAIPALVELAQGGATFFEPGASATSIAALVEERLAGDPVHGLAVRVRTELAWPVVFREHIAPLVAEVLAGTGRPAGPLLTPATP